MFNDHHPYWHVRSIVEQHENISHVSYSRYTYTPQTVEDTRQIGSMQREQFLDPKHIEEIILATPPGQELAIHSNFLLSNGETNHLVMVDMATSSQAHLEKLRIFLGDNLFKNILWFSSGRSFHGYGSNLLNERDWIKFMGLLLLANRPHFGWTVDPRWIGHRLIAGYAALRWTKNTDYYINMPRKIISP